MNVLDWIQGWVRSGQPGPACYACGVTELEYPAAALRQFEDALACHDCLTQPFAYYALMRKFWQEHPEKVPPCMQCGRVVPPGQLHLVGNREWHFCTECTMDGDAMLYWGRFHRRIAERRVRS